MRFRRTLASLLTVMLLSFSSFASDCEIRCDLKSIAGSCHAAAHSGQQGTMSAMAGMVHSAAKQDKAASAVFASQPNACEHHVCAQPLVVLDLHKTALSIDSSHVGLALANPLLFASDPTFAFSLVRGPPLLTRSTPVSLHTTLLI